ncbi:hypothetical protein LEN26_007744 [Aphanomyces euteiches]|nr:hypothetical protein AeMF1_003056 [Aphanomyces euteiches]KAH9131306.1 hypothetical protein LEN26_007744 [Aphanomyces euteiches]
MGRTKLTFPLPSTFFDRPVLTDENRRDYIRLGQSSLVELIKKVRLRDGPVSWTLDHEHQGVRVYRAIDPKTSDVIYVRVKEVPATLDEAARLNDPNRDFCHTYHKSYFVDTHTLYSIATPTPEHPHNNIRIKWHALDTRVFAIRDFCTLEYQDDFVIEGVRGYGRCEMSIELPKFPDMEKAHGLIRGHLHLGGDIYLESDRPGYLTLFRHYHQDIGGVGQRVIDWVSKSTMTRDMGAVDSLFHEARIDQADCLPKHLFVPTSTRSRCAVCSERFTILSKKRNCTRCGEVVCKNCSIRTTTRKFRICNLCTKDNLTHSTGMPSEVSNGRRYGSSKASSGSSAHQPSAAPSELRRSQSAPSKRGEDEHIQVVPLLEAPSRDYYDDDDSSSTTSNDYFIVANSVDIPEPHLVALLKHLQTMDDAAVASIMQGGAPDFASDTATIADDHEYKNW